MRIFCHSFDDNQRVDAVVSGFKKDPGPLESFKCKGSPICEIGYLNERCILELCITDIVRYGHG